MKLRINKNTNLLAAQREQRWPDVASRVRARTLLGLVGVPRLGTHGSLLGFAAGPSHVHGPDPDQTFHGFVHSNTASSSVTVLLVASEQAS